MWKHLTCCVASLCFVSCAQGHGPTSRQDSGAEDSQIEDFGGDTSLTSENSDELCSDGLDNDDDGYEDCFDYSCNRNPAVTVCTDETTNALCLDGIDNDGNGFTDCFDYGCNHDPMVMVCPAETTNPLCSDGIDNDGNGFVDCADFGCSRSTSVTVCL